jgi:hypothetical protein
MKIKGFDEDELDIAFDFLMYYGWKYWFYISIQVLDSFLKESCFFFNFKILLHDLIVKICYKESLFYTITISIYENLKYMIIRENFWIFELIYYVVGKENIVYVKDLLSF